MTTNTTDGEKRIGTEDTNQHTTTYVEDATWQTVINQWAEENHMVVDCASPLRHAVKKALGISDDRPGMAECTVFAHQETMVFDKYPLIRLYVSLPDQQALTEFRDRLSTVAGEYDRDYMTEEATRVRRRLNNFPQTFEVGRHS
jgi:hypothetical protein